MQIADMIRLNVKPMLLLLPLASTSLYDVINCVPYFVVVIPRFQPENFGPKSLQINQRKLKLKNRKRNWRSNSGLSFKRLKNEIKLPRDLLILWKIRLFCVFTNLLGKYFHSIQLKKKNLLKIHLWKSQFKRVKYNRCSIIGARVQSAHFAGGDLNFIARQSANEREMFKHKREKIYK